MPKDNRGEVILEGFEQVAELHGDIVEPVMERFYRRFPEAEESFKFHGLGETQNLEGLMVENAIYFLMTWPDDPEQIRIIISDSIPHHHDTLLVIPHWYIGLIDAVVELILETIASSETSARSVWVGMRDELAAEIERARKLSYHKDDGPPLPAFAASA